MDSATTIKLDDVSIQRAADGTVTITPRAGSGCVSIGLLVTCIVAALVCGGGLVVSGILQLINLEGDNPLGFIAFGVFILAMFGSMANFLFKRAQAGKNRKPITISSIANTVTIGERVIPFGDVAEIATTAKRADIIKMQRVRIARFALVLTNGETIELGSLAVDNSNKDEQSSAVLLVLNTALKKSQALSSLLNV